MKFVAVLLCLALLFTGVSAAEIREEEEDFRKERERKEEILAALFESDISAAREALDNRLVTCVELTEYFLERIEAYNDTFNCFITLCDNAVEEARQRDILLRKEGEHSFLLGIPVVVKDNIAYEGYPTTNGYWRFGSISRETATVVQKLLDAGAVILGKSNMSTEAQDAQFSASDAVGETLNAYGVELACGGSSGGSACATSLNFCYGGLGTDTNASLRYPAVLNGCISLRPTKDLLDREGVIILNYTRDVPGVITRSVEDQAILLGEMAGVDYYSGLDSNALEGMRIGILSELCYNEIARSYRRESKMDEEIKAAFYEATGNLRSLGAQVFHVSVPNLFSLAQNCGQNSSYAIQKYLSVYEALFAENQLDAVVFPTYLHTPDNSIRYRTAEQVKNDVFYSNCALLSSPLGVPEIAIPIAYHSKGSGIGMEIAALKGQEQLLLDIAYTYTKAYETRRVPDTAPSLYDQGRSIYEIIEAEAPPVATDAPEEIGDSTDTSPNQGSEEAENNGNQAPPGDSLWSDEGSGDSSSGGGSGNGGSGDGVPSDGSSGSSSDGSRSDGGGSGDVMSGDKTSQDSNGEQASLQGEAALPTGESDLVSDDPSPLSIVIPMVTIFLPAGSWVVYKYLTDSDGEATEETSRNKKSRKTSKKKPARKSSKAHSRRKKVHK